MKNFPRILLAGCASMSIMATDARAQLFYVGVRGGAAIPTGNFSEPAQGSATNDNLLMGASPGLGYGVDAGIGMGLFGLYAGADRIQFDCISASCAQSGKYKLSGVSAGVRVGVPLLPLIKPWAKAGLTLNELDGTLAGASDEAQINTKRHLGYEVGAGVDIPVLGGFFSLTPQVRLVRQKLDYEAPSVSSPNSGRKEVNYYTFDLGLRLRSPI